jgi:tRNA-specific 2-thiouridylase
MRIVAAMSGGVDSSVAAALLAADGHDVVGLSMQLYDQRDGTRSFGSCCTLDDLHDARRVARRIGIPHYIVNFERQFDERVVAPFVEEYAAARTPIPCVRCNSDMKFASLLDRARGFDAAQVATGHYARVETVSASDGSSSIRRLRRAIDPAKDQCYFLFSLTQSQLARASFPLGDMRKAEVRDYARDHGLLVADKPDSHEICFVPDGDYAAFVERRLPDGPRGGVVVDAAGRVLGRHHGVHRFTVGQRKGLGVSSTVPLYVTALDAASSSVTVGPRTALERTTLTAGGVNWIEGPPQPGHPVTAQIRHHHAPAPARVWPVDGAALRLEFDNPQPAITPGQAVVMYDGDVVLGGGWID